MYLYLAIVFGSFAIGELVSVLTKAKISSVFVTLMLFSVCFLADVFPDDIIELAGLTQISKWALLITVFNMGTMVNLKELVREWRIIALTLISMVVSLASVLAVSPFIGIQSAIVAIPVLNGGIVTANMMIGAATEKGFTVAAALGAMIYAVQKFFGAPPASIFGTREAEHLLIEYRRKNDAQAKDSLQPTQILTIHKKTFANRYKPFFATNTCLFLSASGAFVSSWMETKTGINASIIVLILGACLNHFGIVPDKLLDHAKCSGLLSTALFASIIPALAKITGAELISLSGTILILFSAVFAGLFVCIYLLPTWKIVGSRNLAVGISMAQFLGFPATFLIAQEVANATAKDEEEKEVVMKKLVPAYVVAGMASVTTISIIIAGVLVPYL